ncbi:pyc-1 [Symbiodinium sp. KB8]|nr:pyc-1 [Symbiodinium sp. KB8]
MAANRGEIALRIMRGATELGCQTLGIYAHEDRFSPHRFKADESFMVSWAPGLRRGSSCNLFGFALRPLAPGPGFASAADRKGTFARGYGFLSENANFADALSREGITFVGPPGDTLRRWGDKTMARQAAEAAGVQVIPGSEGPVRTLDDAKAFAAEAGYPVIVKAAHGGGGRGMRVVRSEEEMESAFTRASSEAAAAFGDGTVFLEKFVERPRHIEVQILADSQGNVVHLFDRDCSVQRRHQKVVEMAPALHLPAATREAILRDAVHLAEVTRYENAGTAEFLVDTSDGKHYFLEMNPRVQVEHTVTEAVTGRDIVQSQIQIAAGASLHELGLKQKDIHTVGFAMQCRLTTEDPSANFAPDSGIISVYRSANGPGVRIDEGPGFTGATITPHYDSLLAKVTAHAADFDASRRKMIRALREFRVRGVTTNKQYLIGLLSDEDFASGPVTTRFIEEHPELLDARAERERNRGERLTRYLAQVTVNGPEPTLGATGHPPAAADPILPTLPLPTTPGAPQPPPPSLYSIYKSKGPEAFARAVRASKATLITDTTTRDAHQSLLATRLRTRDILAAMPAMRAAMPNAYSFENWGGATFDVAMRFLRECPWERLSAMREAVPDVPFQMLLRGANGVGYTSYPDNAVHKFCDVAVRSGMDVFRVFDSLNYLPNLQLGMDAVGQAGGIVEAALCYTGDVTNPVQGRYDLDYFLGLARDLVEHGTHVLCVKDMAGLLRPEAATLLIGALRKEFPNTPIHVHTHDTAGTGVASMLAASRAGADAVDAAFDAMSGMTSQPSLGAIVAGLQGTERDTGLDLASLAPVNEYWEGLRQVYAPFESGQLSGSSDVFIHEMPGGQLTNLQFQSRQNNLADRWPDLKRAYAAANRILGDIPKVTPSSKVCGDLAQFMITNDLSEQEVVERAESLSFPSSVVEYLQGYLGVPPYGFPEPFRSRVLKGRTLPSGKTHFEGRPGAELEPLDFEEVEADLRKRFGERITEQDVMSAVMYPSVFADWSDFVAKYGDVSVIPTRQFVSPMRVGEEVAFEIEKGKTLIAKLKFVGEMDDSGQREVVMELNGEVRTARVLDEKHGAGRAVVARPKADKANPAHVASPMFGACVDVKVAVGDTVEVGQPIAVLSAMKMESVITATRRGEVTDVFVLVGETLNAGDLVANIKPAA